MRACCWPLSLLLIACGGAPAAEPSTRADTAADEPAVAGGAAPAAPDPEAPPATPPGNATTFQSGLAVLRLDDSMERGGVPATRRVKVRYRVWSGEGDRLDEGGAEGTLASWLPAALAPGLRQALVDMLPGQRFRAWIPSALTHEQAGDRVYEVEVIEVVAREVPSPPSDVAAIPSDAEVTQSGLASRVLEAGTGIEHPTAESRVTVHYTGWTTDGQRFDSSVERGREATFPLSRVIPGWTEGLQLMVPGEIRRFWIPADLAYGDPPRRPGAPGGMLVFDVELIAIE